jgi:hypothetical protein
MQTKNNIEKIIEGAQNESAAAVPTPQEAITGIHRKAAASHALQLGLTVVRKVEVARAFLALAQAAVRSSSDFNLYVATNHLQDAAEIFLFAVAEHLGVNLKEKGGFDGYFEQINAKADTQLPFRPRLNALNKTRVNAKHYGVQPERKEVIAFVTVVGEFFAEVSRTLLGMEFARISLVHLITNEKIRQHVTTATEAFLQSRYDDCLIETRKAFYREFETAFDVSSFVNHNPSEWWRGWWCKAPAFARNADYIQKNVKEPTDFIVLDHSKIDADLSSLGLSHTTFWNVWRLTPAVFLKTEPDQWVVKHDWRVFAEDGIRQRAEYALHATIDLCLSAQKNREATLSGPHGAWIVKLRRGNIALYSKADIKSPSQALPENLEEIPASSWVEGLDGRIYWSVTLLEPLMFGFVSNDDVLPD